MEAMSFGLPVMAPAINSNLPVLIDKDNFQLFFRLNFSQRVKVTDEMNERNDKGLLKIADGGNGYLEAGNFSREMFNRYFNVINAVANYKEVYNRAAPGNNFELLGRNISYIVREIINGGKR